MKFRIFVVLIFICHYLNAQQTIYIYPEMWTTTQHWDGKYVFLCTESITVGQIERKNFNLIFGKGENSKYYIITEIQDAPQHWRFKGKLNIISGLSAEINCIDRNLNSNTNHNGTETIRSLYFLTSTEFQNIQSQGIKSVMVGIQQYENIKSYSFNNFYIKFDSKSKYQREQEQIEKERVEAEQRKKEQEERRVQDSIAYEKELENLTPENRARIRAENEARKKAKAKVGKQFSKPSNNGDPGADPIGESIDGLNGRAIRKKGTVKVSNYTAKGKVVIDICVDERGNVVSAIQNKNLSNSTDYQLVSSSIEAAKSYQFVLSDIQRQCGKLTFYFKNN
jgi:hypothetical protein